MTTEPSYALPLRMRRLRRLPNIAASTKEHRLHVDQFIYPIFIKDEIKEPAAIPNMPGVYQWPTSHLAPLMDECTELKINRVLLFGVTENKDPYARSALDDEGPVPKAIAYIKKNWPNITIITDLCLCAYTDHGHCGLLNEHRDIDNDSSLEILSQQAIMHAQSGADIVAPSAMMDGMVTAIRQALDSQRLLNTPILSYAAKFCSSFYGPFRSAAESPPQFGDRRSYQMEPANGQEALREVELDIQEGADMVMVKPALSYLDVIYNIHQQYPEVPLAAYQVSGEYAMIKAATKQGAIDERQVVLETCLSMVRAGANMIISYYSLEIAKWLNSRI